MNLNLSDEELKRLEDDMRSAEYRTAMRIYAVPAVDALKAEIARLQDLVARYQSGAVSHYYRDHS